ncbi:MAG TPA: OmpA family protein [Dongiaceae bacterium]|nr:OmpA family protein [Dongiaceae bacterium]
MNRIASVLALSFAGVCTASGLAFAQSDATPTLPAETLLAQASTQQYVVLFALDDATLDSEALATIAAAAQEFQRTGSARIALRGHTDTSGNAAYNQALSERREQAVTDELVRQGVPADAISGVAVGEADPAVPTGDGVPEEQNRRVEIALEAPPPPPPAPEPAPAPAPEPAPQAVAEPEPESRLVFSVGPFYGYNIEDLNGGDSHFGGLNLSLDYEISPWFSAGLEQAGFYHFSTDNDGFGGRSAASLDLLLGRDDVVPYLGGNIGYLYGSGIDEDFFAGPEIGIRAGAFNAKVAYDMPFNRDAGEGVVATTIGFGFRF